MWRMTPRLATATLTATLALVALTGSKAQASAVQSYSYSTTTSLGDVSNGPITLTGVSPFSGNQLTTPGAFVLGEFTTSPLPSTATLTYTHTPFTIDLKVMPSGSFGSSFGTPSYDYIIHGELNGSITNGSSQMVASITSISGSGSAGVNATPPFPIDALQLTLPQGIAAPNGLSFGNTSLIAQVTVAGVPLPTPEPTSIAAFAVALAGWGLRRRLRARA
jgi:hypothetical protein